MAYDSVAYKPFCETHDCWLDSQKQIDKLDAFSDPDHVAALRAGNIAPLEAARPRVPASGQFARLILRHSPKCDDFCTLTIQNVTVTMGKDNKPEEKAVTIMLNLLVPKTMLEYLAQFDHISARRVSDV